MGNWQQVKFFITIDRQIVIFNNILIDRLETESWLT